MKAKRMSNNFEARRRHKIGTQISQALGPGKRTRTEVGNMLGISAEMVRQIETAALFKIAKRLSTDMNLDTRNGIDIDWRKV